MSATEKPILFAGAMVRAILAGRKTQTRRVMKPQIKVRGEVTRVEPNPAGEKWLAKDSYGVVQGTIGINPEINAGDVLWVRETWGSRQADHPLCKNGRKPQAGDELYYRANPADDCQWGVGKPSQGSFVWRPSIHMPRWASRLTLTVTGVRAERLQDISEADAVAEGVEFADFSDLSRRFKNYLAKKEDLNFHGNFSHKTCHWCARASYGSLWDSIYGPGSAAKNPWVWVYQFEVLEVKK